MPFDDSLIGNNDFDPRTATEDLIRRVTPDAPDTLEPRALTTRLARKLGQPEPKRAPTPPEHHDQPTLDFSSQALPAANMEPGDGKNDLDFTSQVTPPPPPVDGGIGGPTALAKGLVTGAARGLGGVMKGAARLGNQAAPYLESLQYDAYGNVVGQAPMQPPSPIENNPLYKAGDKLENSDLENVYREQLGIDQKPPIMSPEEQDSLTGRVGTMVGGIAPYAAAGAVGGPALGMAAGFTGFAADTYGKVYEDAKAKGADDATAQTAASKSAAAAGILGSLPLGTGHIAKSIVGKIISQGLTFASTNEATEYVLQEIAKDYDEKAGYHPEAKRIIASLITGGMLGGLHAFERKRPETRQDTASDTSGQEAPAGAIPKPEADFEQKPWEGKPWGGAFDDDGAGPQPGPGPQSGPQPGGAHARPEGEQAKGPEQPGGEPPKGEGQDIPDDYTMDPKTRAKMERVFRTFDRTGNPSKMTDAELYRAVNEHLRDTSSTGYTAKEDTAQDKAQRDQHQAKQTEDAELKAAFPWMKDSQIASMTPDMREVWLNRARGPKPGEKPKQSAEDAAADADARKAGFRNANEVGPDEYSPPRSERNAEFNDGDMARGETPIIEKTGTREAPIAAKTADDVMAAKPAEPKSAAQAEAENYRHAHMELEHLGLKGGNSISIETGVGQTRKGPPGPDGKPSWEVKMEQGAYGRIKGTRGADGQPLDIMVGPHPNSSHVFIINQHDPATGKFDELKIQAGYRTPLDALHAYAVSFDDHARGRVGGMVAMTAEQFQKWLKTGDHTKAVQHASNPASVLARAFPEAGGQAKGGASDVASESIAPSAGLHNAAEGARRPLTEAPAETSSPEVPKGSREGDAKEATARPALTTTHQRGRSEAGENISLLEFLADRGGIAPHPELEAIGFGGMHRVQIPGRKGFFGLIKQGGWDLDTAREAAEEAGYLQGDTPDATSTIRHLLDAMDSEARGTKLYPFQGEGQRTKAETRTDKERTAYEEEQYQRYYSEANAELDAEYPELPRDLRDTAARAMVLDGFDVDTAVEYAAIWEVNRDNELYEVPQHSIIETFGPEAKDAIQAAAAHGDGAQARRDGQQEADARGAEAGEGDGRDVQEARAEGGEGAEGARGEAAGQPAEAEGASPVRSLFDTEHEAAGRERAAGDEARDADQDRPAAEDADNAGVVTADSLPVTPEDVKSRPVHLGTVFRGTAASTTDVLKPAAKGDLGAGLYLTPNQRIAASYGGGPKATVANGMRKVHEIEIAPLQPEDVAFIFGARKVDEKVTVIRGDDALLWRGPYSGENLEDLFKRMPDIKAVVGTPESVGLNQIAIRDPSIVTLKTKPEVPGESEQDAASKQMEAALDKIEEAVESGDRKAVSTAVLAAKKTLKDIPQPIKDADPKYWSSFVGTIRAMGKPGYVTGEQAAKAAREKAGIKDDGKGIVKSDGFETLFDVDGYAYRTPKGPLVPGFKTRAEAKAAASVDDRAVAAKIEREKAAEEEHDRKTAEQNRRSEKIAEQLRAGETTFGPYKIEPLTQDRSGIWQTRIKGNSIDVPQHGFAGGDKDHFIDVQLAPYLRGLVDRYAELNPTTETGADGKQQTVIAGAEKASDKTMAQRGAAAPLKPKVAQKGADVGLFGDERNQTDMFSTPPKKAPEPAGDNFDAIFDEAINEQFAKPVSLDQATEGLKAIFGKKKPPSGLAESEAPFSDDTYAQALPYLKAGVANFADAGDLTAMVRALVSHLANSGMDRDAIQAMKPYIRRFTDDVRSGKESLNAPSRREVLERDRGNPAAEDAVGGGDVSAPAGGAGRRAGARGAEAPARDERPAGGERVPQDYAPVVGERGHLEIPEREPVADDGDAASAGDARGDAGGQEGFSFDDRADAEAEADAQRDADINARRQRQREADAKRIPLKHGDLENIAATLPMLFPEQHLDVKAAEERFAKADGHGMLFTNGTGTGKTYSGLGIIKRFALAGKRQAIVIAPSQGILMDWQRSARDLGLEMHILDSTVDKGKPGLNGTTYANFGENPTLADQEWDLVVPDEAHKLSSDQDGTTTKALRTLRALTMHPAGLMRRAEMVLRGLYDKIGPPMEKAPADYEAQRNAAIAAYNAKAEPLIAKWRGQKRTNKAAFLSATPFAYHFSLDWAEGYLFDFPPDTNSGAYNAPTGRDQFYIQHLGYRKKTGKLTKPDAEVKQEVMERQLHEYLRKTGSLAGRMLTVDKDYDRKFILAHDAIGNQIDQALNFLQDNEAFQPLVDYVAKRFDYLTRMRLLEAIKARAAIPYIKESLALGRKVVVFHDYNEGGGINPFELTFSDDAKTTRYANGKHEDVALKPLYEEFVRQNPYVKDLKFASYGPPIETLTGAFPNALVYNGTVSAKKRNAAKALFNDDNSGHDLIIVQSAAGEAGISLHDTTGKHQRVTLNLGMPIRPVSSIQQEGRIYRVGQASDALFRYMNTGTDWERWTFAGKIADRAGTAENLALGNQARTIRQAFIDAFANAEDYRPEPGEGTGGKAADRAITHSMSEFEKAKTHYYAQQKVSGRRDQREGKDYYATPEPLGLKMVEWANVKSGEKILEPSAGHGAIARYFPEDTHRTLVEPSSSLASRASLNSTGARVVVDRFENLDTGANKFDAIVMNPPFGTAGATAIEHVAKAAKHLKNGGRIVALIPRGNTDAKFDKFMDSPAAKGIYLVADINLPPVTFERAGTKISARVVVLEKQTDPEISKQLQQQSRDYTSAETIGELFDRLENSEISDRLEPTTKDVDAPAQGRITVNGIEFMLEDDAKRSPDKPTFYAVPKNTFRDRFRDVVGYAEKAGGRYGKPYFMFPTAEARQAFLDMVANPPKAPDKPSGVTFKSGETVHGKTGKKVFVASPDQRVERAVYDQMNAAAKAEGGYYSSFTGRGAIPGFQFPSAEARDKFLAKMGGSGGLGEPEALGSAPQQYDPDLTPAERRELDDLESRRDDLSRDELDRYDDLERRLLLQEMREGVSAEEARRAFQSSRSKRQGAAAQDFTLAMGRKTGNEWLAAIGPNGDAVWTQEGDQRSINFLPQFEQMALNPASDMVVHHNHPSGRSLSAPDVSILAFPGIKAVWAHGHNGNVYRVALTDEARKALPADVTQARVKLYKLYNVIADNLVKMMNPAVQGGSISAEDANMAHGQLVMEMLRDAGVVDYETNTDPVGLIPQIQNLSLFIERALPHVTANLFGGKTAPNRNDRRARPVRHAGDVGASFDRVALLPTVGPAAGNDRARREGDRAQAQADRGVGGDQLRLLDGPPGLEDLDKTFNDLLGKRLLGRLGDLNATEMRVQLQDKFARVRNVEQDKGNTDTALSAYQAEALYYGRTGQRLESLKEHVVDPIIREMKGRSIDLDSMDKFLYARHAPERNNVVGALYPDDHDFKRATIDPRVKGASGMSTNEANSFIGRLRADGKLADYQAVARMVDALNFRTRQTLFNAGLIDRATFDGLNSQYRYYVPLRGWQEGSNEDTLPRQSKGMDTRAKAFKQAFGRQSLAASPLAYSIMQAEQAVVKAEKNKVGNTFLRFARANPDPDLWTIDRPEPRKYVSKVTGMVHSSPTWDMNDPKTFVTRVDGRAVMIQFKGEDGANLARAMKNMGTSNIHSAVRMMAAVTHTMARLATAWNPEFMIPNLIRDIGEAFINLGEQRQRDFVRKFAANILPAMKGSWQAIAEKNPGDPYVEAFNEFDREGGRVRFFGIDDPDVIEKNVEKRLKRLSGGTINSIKDLGDKAGKAMEIMGGGIENATRLAAYMAAKDVGMSAPDAAMLARNLTVNFNKKGELGTAIGSAYMFANASIQGQARMLRALHPKNRRVWMAVGALAASGVMSASFNLGIGGNDQAGMANYMKIPSWERDKNIIIMGAGETYGKIPLPYGFAPFHVLGAHATTVLMGHEKPTAAAAAVFGSIASSFNPLGEEESAIATVVPTALRPAVHIHYNENWTGKPLYPARDADKGKPESQQSFRTDTAASKFVAEKLNEMSGGDRYRPGAIDIHPGTLDHIMGAITGGVGKFFKNIIETVMNGWNGKEWEAAKTPILRRFVGKIDHNMADSAAYYEARKEVVEEANRTRQARRDLKTGSHTEEARGYLDSTPAGRQKIIFDRADQQMRKLRAEEERVNSSAQPYEEKRRQLDALRLQMRDVQNRARAESARLKQEQRK